MIRPAAMSPGHSAADAFAVVGGHLCTGLVDLTSDLAALDSEGFWAVVIPFRGDPWCGRFSTVRPARPPSYPLWPGPRWCGPDVRAWTSGLDRRGFEEAVARIRSEIAAGDVYQVNLTRRVRAPLPRPARNAHTTDIAALGAVLAEGNPAPYAAVVRIPAVGIHVASASPELFLARGGRTIRSAPIKGTAADPQGFLDKDRAENVMIVDLVRNDLGRVCQPGSIRVPRLLDVEEHPGLFHLVSTVEGELRHGCGWAEAIGATFPPGSVTGAPKIAALESIARHEPDDRDLYCGAIGWVDADRDVGELNVAIRTFWIRDGELNFGTGGAITWDSDPHGEWAETELKATKLLSITSTNPTADPSGRTGVPHGDAAAPVVEAGSR